MEAAVIFYNTDKEKIIYVNNINDNGFLDVQLAGTTYPNPDYHILKSSDNYYVFEYVVSGSGHITYGTEKYKVEAGDFYYFARPAQTYYHADKNEPYEKIWVNVTGTFIDTLTEMYHFKPVFVKRVNVRQSFLEIHDILEHMTVEDSPALIKLLSRCFFVLISDVGHSTLFNDDSENTSSAAPMKNFIDNNIYNEINLDVMSDYFHVTKMHIIRMFKQEFGITPMQYVITKRLEIAKNLLVNTTMPIKEISSLLQYSNTQHFSNTYRKITGYSPNRQRRISREMTNSDKQST